MNRLISLILIFTMIFCFIPSISNGQGVKVYEGISEYEDLYDNVDFNDIEDHWAKEHIYKMSSLSIIKGMGDKTFEPEATLTKEQAVILLTRLIGLEAQAHTIGEESVQGLDTGGYAILSNYDYWVRGYIEAATDNGILTEEEINDITSLSDRQQDAVDERVDNQLQPYNENYNISEEQYNNIKTQITEKAERYYTWGTDVDREQIAVWVARLMNLEPITGQAQQRVYNLEDWEQIDTQNIPIIEAVIKSGIMQGNDEGEFNPKGSLTRGQMAKILDSIADTFLKERKYKINKGIVKKVSNINKTSENSYTGEKEYNNVLTISISNEDDTVMNIAAEQNIENKKYENGFIVYKNGSLISPREIDEYNYVKYYVNPQDEVVYVDVLENTQTNIEGYIEEVNIDEEKITLKDYYDVKHKLDLSKGAEIKVNGQNATIADLLYGQEVVLYMANGTIKKIEAFLDEGKEGYIHPGDRIHMGKVLYIEDDSITINKDGKHEKFNLDEFIPIINNGRNVDVRNIRVGDIVRLEFDQYDTKTPTKIYVSKEDKQLSNLIKANILDYDQSRDELLLANVEYFDDYEWKNGNQQMNLDIAYDSNIYIDGREINKENLSSYFNREAYIATEDSFGNEEAFKIVFKSGYEKKYHDSIQDIAFGEKNINVDYDNVSFDYDSTIILKEGRLIHPYNLRENDDVFLVAHGSNAPVASFISVQGIKDTGFTIYRGEIEEIGRYTFEIDDFDIIEGVEWDYESRQTELNISEDTEIIDTRNDGYKQVSVEDFTNSRFYQEDEEENYYDEYTYAIEYDNMIVALDIIDKDKSGQVLSIGDIASIDRENEKIKITDVEDWNDFESTWNINKTNITLDVQNALIVKEGKVISINDVRENDSVYVLRKNSEGFIVVVR